MALSRQDEKLQNLLTDIMMIALEDGIITDEEMAILKRIKLDIKELQHKIENGLNSENLSEEEKTQLKEWKKAILKNAYELSSEDFNITRDERALISGLVKLMMFE